MVTTRRSRPNGSKAGFMQGRLRQEHCSRYAGEAARHPLSASDHVEINKNRGKRRMISPARSTASSSSSSLSSHDSSDEMIATATATTMVRQTAVSTGYGITTSPRSMSPSSLFEYQAEDEFDVLGEDEFDEHGIRGWLSSTSKHMSDARGATLTSSPIKAKALRAHGATSYREDVEGQGPSNSPTISRQAEQNRLQTKSHTLPHAVNARRWIAEATPSSQGSHGGLLSRSRSTNAVAGPSTVRRPATPSSSSSRSQRSALPTRPQSAMKHKSANEYSSGKNVPTIVVSSGSLPRSSIDDDDFFNVGGGGGGGSTSTRRAQTDVNRSHTHSYPTNQTRPAPATSKRKETPSAMSDSDGFSPSPVKVARVARAKRTRYVLHSRASLPQTSFYQRTKREEGSPTPMSKPRWSDLTF